jgi:hypothetical protein
MHTMRQPPEHETLNHVQQGCKLNKLPVIIFSTTTTITPPHHFYVDAHLMLLGHSYHLACWCA